MLFKTDRELAFELGKRVREHRIRRRMSQLSLAAKAGVHVNTVRALERTGEVMMRSFIAVLRALGERADLEHVLDTPPPRDLYSAPTGPSDLPRRVREKRE
jgi:transcriptional regulator with XRE-family HTH domain